jgi:hypothetical protein
MTWPTVYDRTRISLATDRISPADAERQSRTAEELLRRLATQPGIILADEVGMGKTFVALATAMAAMWADKGKRPVVIMVPTSVQRKWARDFGVFREKCLRNASDRNFRWAEAHNAVEFFRLLDDTPAKRARLIFLTHGSFHRTLTDPWIKLAIMRFAMHHAKLGERRRTLPRFAADILRIKGKYAEAALFEKLLGSGFDRWRDIISKFGDDPGDDPVPEAVAKALMRSRVDLGALRDALADIPLRDSKNIEERLKAVRRALNDSFQSVWQEALINAAFRSPLLILDEAHHAKNPATKLASLFVSDEADHDARMLSGALEGGFERMLFLTATPFQLGHHELLNVIDRFQGIDWKSLDGDTGKARFCTQCKALSDALDEAQRAAVELDWQWGKLRRSDVPGSTEQEIEAWWRRLLETEADQPERIQQVVRSYRRTLEALRTAEQHLRPWVVRHTRSRTLTDTGEPRRQRLPGRGIWTMSPNEASGLPIADSALLPFLLASRAQAVVAHVAREQGDHRVYRATFAEGLASCYETFLETRAESEDAMDERATDAEVPSDARLALYLSRLHESLPDEATFAEHPKVAATISRVADLWEAGEKVVVFCHYRVTGRALVKHISRAITQRLWTSACRRLSVSEAEARQLADSWSDGFELERPLGRTIRTTTIELLAELTAIGSDQADRIADIARRFVRTPMFLARFVDLTREDRPEALAYALRHGGTESLRGRLDAFARFLADLTSEERDKYLDALARIHPGPQYEQPDEGEIHGGAQLQPNVRLASGAVRPEARERLLLGFNTPFFPEVLIASSVMAEGVDLHLNCRHMIHHDLDWNPSVLEQRTGRVDRINSKAEKVGHSIEVCLPYVGGTQDEKMYRVVMDRERWFQIVMGEEYKTDEYATEQIAERVPLPGSIARELALRLETQ